jgi:hypothetical protein
MSFIEKEVIERDLQCQKLIHEMKQLKKLIIQKNSLYKKK